MLIDQWIYQQSGPEGAGGGYRAQMETIINPKWIPKLWKALAKDSGNQMQHLEQHWIL